MWGRSGEGAGPAQDRRCDGGHPGGPQVFGDLEVDAGAPLAFSEDARSRTGARVRVRTGDDVELRKTKTLLGAIPMRLLGPFLRFGTWLTTDRDLDLKRFGMPRRPFGSAMVSSVGVEPPPGK